MKKIMLVIASLRGGGAERVMAQLADALIEQAVEVHLVTWAGSASTDFYPVDARVFRHELGPGKPTSGLVRRLIRGLSTIRGLRALMRRTSPDCVLSFLDQSNVLTLVAAIGLTSRVVVSERIDPWANDTLGFGWILARVFAYQRAQLVVAQTDAVATLMARRWRVRTAVIPNFLRPLPAPTIKREPCLISVGRLVPQKAFDVSIRAFARVSQKHPDWQYVILGEGPRREEWEHLSHRLGLSERVRFTGLVDDVERWLERASIAVQPSRFEGFPNAVMEAMAMGVATISADCPSGPADLIEHLQNGMLVPVDDEDAIAEAMTRLMSDQALRQSLGSRAMAIREKLSPKKVMSHWTAVLFDESETQ